MGLCRGGRKQRWKPLDFVTVDCFVECGCAVGGVCISNSVGLQNATEGLRCTFNLCAKGCGCRYRLVHNKGATPL